MTKGGVGAGEKCGKERQVPSGSVECEVPEELSRTQSREQPGFQGGCLKVLQRTGSSHLPSPCLTFLICIVGNNLTTPRAVKMK
jgi:hypothetical protein